MTDDRAREEFERSARAHIAALQGALAKQLFRRDARNAAVDDCVGKLTVAAEMWGDARVLAAGRHSGAEADRLRAERDQLKRELDAERFESTVLRDALMKARNAQQAPEPPPKRPRKPRTNPATREAP
jgi:hypothetical protein